MLTEYETENKAAQNVDRSNCIAIEYRSLLEMHQGIGCFDGHICHSSQSTQPELVGDADGSKRAIVVGCGVSGHDIARDFYDHAYDVMLVQRGPTCIDRTACSYGQGLYSEDGPPTGDADFLTQSVPLPLLKRREVEKIDPTHGGE
ncbi:hypothetical protein F4823DRAFT_558413 [Ustulina deusta]|nr:hypothetical protein F4823DRAFT_558413 [Ustulina deusta]